MLTGDFLSGSARRHPDRIAVAQDSQRISYAQLDADANRFANALLDRGLGKGARIAVIAPNIPEYAIAYFGAARAGCVSAHISTRATASDVRLMLERIDAQLVLFDSSCAASVLPGLGAGPGRHAVVMNDGVTLPQAPTPVLSLREILDQSHATPIDIDLMPSDALAITFTGGTTGSPKAVVVSHGARYASARIATTRFGLTDDDVMGIATPLFHAAGLFVCFAPTILLGAGSVLLRSWNAGQFIETVERERITATFMVPTQLGDLISHPGFSAARLASLRNISYAGAPMPANLLARVQDALPHARFTENYGQSETGPLTVRRASDPAEKLNTVGTRVAEVEISRDDGSVAGPGEIGEIVTRGPHVFSEYFGDPQQTAQAFRDGWLRTGDVGYFDDQGFLVLVDRIKDIIICGGENIYPAEIENVLFRHPAVAECAAFGIPDDRRGELPAAHVVLSRNASVTEDALIEFCTTQIAPHKRPRVINFVASLPRTPVGKIQRNVIRAEYWRDRSKSI